METVEESVNVGRFFTDQKGLRCREIAGEKILGGGVGFFSVGDVAVGADLVARIRSELAESDGEVQFGGDQLKAGGVVRGA